MLVCHACPPPKTRQGKSLTQLSVESNYNCVFAIRDIAPLLEKLFVTMLRGNQSEISDELAVVVEVIAVCLVRIHTRGADDRTRSIHGYK